MPLKTTRRTTRVRARKKDTGAIPQPTKLAATPRKKTVLMPAPEAAPPPPQRPRWFLVLIGGAVLLLVVAGAVYFGFSRRGRPDLLPVDAPAGDPLELRQKVRSAQRRLEAQGKSLQLVLSQSLIQKGTQSGPVRIAHEKVRADVASLQNELKTWPVPTDSASRGLYQSFARYLQVRSDSLDKFGDAITSLEDSSLSLVQKSNQINQHLRTIQLADQKQEQELSQALERFAREHGAEK